MEFAKLQALGNDFVIVEAASLPSNEDLEALARRLCDRHYGIGADGLVVVDSATSRLDSDVATRIFNADGGEAEVSGNGTRCVAAYLESTRRWPSQADALRIATAAGVKRVRRDGDRYEMDMGVPKFGSADVPMAVDPPLDRVIGYPIHVGGRVYAATVTSVGNPHCTLFFESLDDVDVRSIGPLVERHPLFPNRVNVEFVEVVAEDRIRARFWERGAGETLSSGTGSTAAAVAAIVNGLVGRRATVATPAGELTVTWREADESVLLAGPAALVYTGVWRA